VILVSPMKRAKNLNQSQRNNTSTRTSYGSIFRSVRTGYRMHLVYLPTLSQLQGLHTFVRSVSKNKAVAYSMPHILPAGIVENVEILSREIATGRALNPEPTENVVGKLPTPPRRLLSGFMALQTPL